jgi:hypothetical protein
MTLPQNEPYSSGVSAGLRSALVSLLVFFWLGCGVPMSIFLGTLMGLGMGRIVYWWELKDEVALERPIADDSLEDVAVDRRVRQKRFYARHYRSRRKLPLSIPGVDRLLAVVGFAKR